MRFSRTSRRSQKKTLISMHLNQAFESSRFFRRSWVVWLERSDPSGPKVDWKHAVEKESAATLRVGERSENPSKAMARLMLAPVPPRMSRVRRPA